MFLFFSILMVIAIFAFIAGMVKPDWVIRWGENKTRKQVLIIYGLAFIIFAVIAVSFQPEPTVKSMVTEARNNVDSGNYKQAVLAYEEIINNWDKEEDSSVNLNSVKEEYREAKKGYSNNLLTEAKKAIVNNDLDEAEEKIKNAEKYWPDNEDIVLMELKLKFKQREINDNVKLITKENFYETDLSMEEMKKLNKVFEIIVNSQAYIDYKKIESRINSYKENDELKKVMDSKDNEWNKLDLSQETKDWIKDTMILLLNMGEKYNTDISAIQEELEKINNGNWLQDDLKNWIKGNWRLSIERSILKSILPKEFDYLSVTMDDINPILKSYGFDYDIKKDYYSYCNSHRFYREIKTDDGEKKGIGEDIWIDEIDGRILNIRIPISVAIEKTRDFLINMDNEERIKVQMEAIHKNCSNPKGWFSDLVNLILEPESKSTVLNILEKMKNADRDKLSEIGDFEISDVNDFEVLFSYNTVLEGKEMHINFSSINNFCVYLRISPSSNRQLNDIFTKYFEVYRRRK